MSTILDKIADIENEMSKTQKNKATSAHLGLLKAKLAKLRSGIALFVNVHMRLLGHTCQFGQVNSGENLS